jgi:two-component system chemotaxis response regulator CheB
MTAKAAEEKVIVIGASTGGTEAIREVLTRMPAGAPGILVAQHMPEGFTRSFAARLDTLCSITVKEAKHGEHVLPGHAYIAPGHSHLLLGWSYGRYLTILSQAEPVNRHRPSVDVLFESAARAHAANVLGVILTGMGKDGAAGLRVLHRAGAYTYAQDEHSCIVFGMPREAIALGGVDEVLPVESIAPALLARLALYVNGGSPRKLKHGEGAAVKALPYKSERRP